MNKLTRKEKVGLIIMLGWIETLGDEDGDSLRVTGLTEKQAIRAIDKLADILSK